MTPEQKGKPKIHKLKTWPEYFQKIKSGEKRFELRRNDRNFKVDDTLLLQEWDYKGFSAVNPHERVGAYTGNELRCKVTYILSVKPEQSGLFGLDANFCIMGIEFAATQRAAAPLLKWVKLEEGCNMPDYDDPVLWFFEDGNMNVEALHLDGNPWLFGHDKEVEELFSTPKATHWMPLPAPPSSAAAAPQSDAELLLTDKSCPLELMFNVTLQLHLHKRGFDIGADNELVDLLVKDVNEWIENGKPMLTKEATRR